MVSRSALIKTTLLVLALMWASVGCLVTAVGPAPEAGSLAAVWQVNVPGATTAVRARVDAGGPDVVVIVGNTSVVITSTEGAVVRRTDRAGIVVGATGDVDGDGGDDVVLARRSGQTQVEVLSGKTLATLWSVTLGDATPPTRVVPVDLDGDGKKEVVVGETGGAVHALSSGGKPLWSLAAPPDLSGAGATEVRGLDDVKTTTGRRVAVAWQGGALGLFDGRGQQLWLQRTDRIRRMRAFDVNGDGVDEVLFGCEAGGYTVNDAAGRQVYYWGLGEPVVEIRPIEVDGDPKNTEVAIGGKKGLSRLMSGNTVLAEFGIGERVTAMAGIDTNTDGRDEIFVGTEQGTLSVFHPSGRGLVSLKMGGKVDAITAVASARGDRMAVAANGARTIGYRLSSKKAPVWYSPYAAGTLGTLATLGVAVALLRLKPAAPPPPPPAPSLPPRVRSLSEQLGKLEAFAASGLLPRDAIADRVTQIRERIDKVRRAPPQQPPASPPPPPTKKD